MLRTRVVPLDFSVPQVRTNILPVPTKKKKKKNPRPGQTRHGVDLKLESLSTMETVQFTHQKLYTKYHIYIYIYTHTHTQLKHRYIHMQILPLSRPEVTLVRLAGCRS